VPAQFNQFAQANSLFGQHIGKQGVVFALALSWVPIARGFSDPPRIARKRTLRSRFAQNLAYSLAALVFQRDGGEGGNRTQLTQEISINIGKSQGSLLSATKAGALCQFGVFPATIGNLLL
jgi:hypothetical protein